MPPAAIARFTGSVWDKSRLRYSKIALSVAHRCRTNLKRMMPSNEWRAEKNNLAFAGYLFLRIERYFNKEMDFLYIPYRGAVNVQKLKKPNTIT